MKKIFGVVLAVVLMGVIATQAQFVSAKSKEVEKGEKERRVTSPLTSPCKPGWGYGDKNHCHSGPSGLTHNHNNEKNEKHDK